MLARVIGIRLAVGFILGVQSVLSAFAQDAPREDVPVGTYPDKPGKTSDAQNSLCLLIESAARANGLPVEFFARVIWQESRFRADAVGPATRSGKRAEGIAQFMPGTAAERQLLNPFDPIQALPKSAEFLRDLRRQFGNLGLAAAAYNAGPRRVREWMNGAGAMPSETRNYVFAITGASVEQWSKTGPDGDRKQEQGVGCGELVALLKHAPNRFVAALEERIGVVLDLFQALGRDDLDRRERAGQVRQGVHRASEPLRLPGGPAASYRRVGDVLSGHVLSSGAAAASGRVGRTMVRRCATGGGRATLPGQS